MIDIIEPKKAKKTLGVYTCTAGCAKAHVEYMAKKGNKWNAQIKANKYVRPKDGWLSYDIQLKPKIEWGLTSVCAETKDWDKAMDKVQHDALGSLGVNQKINKMVRMLPESFGGRACIPEIVKAMHAPRRQGPPSCFQPTPQPTPRQG